ncbi:agmatine deiminase family protein [Sphingomicrobium astaxanthinifaciens]|uniref:agmatine deiminase family protein n=1 Tax=Sphingomicrobium astaxanthinifaciens TaxID=1227949 RepID=UPI001FCB8E23|nr:agmatine deiminase family protein [Sphingomicrobium astaxanthinifaciens]MCJ7422090.1 agmatine deiminase family protein [Sphingomicrobium astaxanthinifaciens]
MTNAPPPEWAPHDAMWIGFPSHPDLWEDDLAPAQAEVAALAAALHAGGEGEEIRLVAATEEAAAEARRLAPFATVIVEPFGDIWLRDTGPIILGTGDARRAQGFGFNGWGGKYELEGDDSVGERLAATADLPYQKADWILEGGAIDGDGSGTFITTEECLLNPNRNPGLSREQIEEQLKRDLGATRIVWLGNGLRNDHTDGHVDNLARFVAPGKVAIPEPAGEADPNADAYADAAAALLDADLEVTAIPSPGAVMRPDPETGEQRLVPASYMNFLIGNAAVVVPLYGAANDLAAIEAIGGLFPDHRVTGIRADHILTGGGSFHCISQQVPQ